jgi:sporulation integral membrane protein YtvI
MIPFYNKTATLFNNLDNNQQDTIIKNVQNIGQTITATSSGFIQSFLTSIPAIIGWFPNTATILFFSLMATFFISKDWYRLEMMTNKILPRKISSGGKRIVNDLIRALLGFIRAQFTLTSLTTMTVLIGLLIMKVNYSITIALICGLIDLIPYLGTGVIFIPWMIYELIIGNTSFTIGLAVLYIIVIVQRQLIEPKVLSSSIGIDPLATLVALFIGYKLIGFFGLILGPIVLVIINTFHRAHVFTEVWSFIIGQKKE